MQPYIQKIQHLKDINMVYHVSSIKLKYMKLSLTNSTDLNTVFWKLKSNWKLEKAEKKRCNSFTSGSYTNQVKKIITHLISSFNHMISFSPCFILALCKIILLGLFCTVCIICALSFMYIWLRMLEYTMNYNLLYSTVSLLSHTHI